MFIMPVCLDFEDDNYPSDESLANQKATVSFGPNPTHGGRGYEVKSFVLKMYLFIQKPVEYYKQRIFVLGWKTTAVSSVSTLLNK